MYKDLTSIQFLYKFISEALHMDSILTGITLNCLKIPKYAQTVVATVAQILLHLRFFFLRTQK